MAMARPRPTGTPPISSWKRQQIVSDDNQEYKSYIIAWNHIIISIR